MSDHAPQKNRVCLHCGADVPFGFTNCWLCRKRWDSLEPESVSRLVPKAKPSPARPMSQLMNMVLQATAASHTSLFVMLILGQIFGPRFFPIIIILGVTGVFIASWYYLSWNSSIEPTVGQVISRFVRSALLTFVILVAFPVAVIIALLVLCFGMMNFAGYMDGRH